MSIYMLSYVHFWGWDKVVLGMFIFYSGAHISQAHQTGIGDSRWDCQYWVECGWVQLQGLSHRQN